VVWSWASLGGTVERRNAGAAGDFEVGAVGETANVRWQEAAGDRRRPMRGPGERSRGELSDAQAVPREEAVTREVILENPEFKGNE
jgi:hypothetical protein